MLGGGWRGGSRFGQDPLVQTFFVMNGILFLYFRVVVPRLGSILVGKSLCYEQYKKWVNALDGRAAGGATWPLFN